MRNTKPKTDVYTQVTNQIVEAIEKGAGKFEMPWHRTGQNTMCPVNIDTGNNYRGINILSLWASSMVRGYADGTWGTYRQWQNRGCQVRKGEKASLVVFYKEFDVEQDASENADDDKSGKRMMARASYVFNAEQVDGYEAEPLPEVANPVDALDAVDAFIAACGADVRTGGQQAYYKPSEDYIQMPPQEMFIGSPTRTPTESYYSTLLHELTHWTGHSSRCDRFKAVGSTRDDYAREELVAEIGAAFLCAELGVALDPRPDHAAYIDHWLKILKEDRKAIFKASSAASRAAGYLNQFQGISSAGRVAPVPV